MMIYKNNLKHLKNQVHDGINNIIMKTIVIFHDILLQTCQNDKIMFKDSKRQKMYNIFLYFFHSDAKPNSLYNEVKFRYECLLFIFAFTSWGYLRCEKKDNTFDAIDCSFFFFELASIEPKVNTIPSCFVLCYRINM